MIVPLVAGLLFKAYFQCAAHRIRWTLRLFTNFTLILAIVLVVAVNFRGIVSLAGTGAIIPVLIVVILAGGRLLDGRTEKCHSQSNGIGTGFRNIAAVLVVSECDLPVEATAMLILGALLGFLFLLPITRMMQQTGHCEWYRSPTARLRYFT